MKKNLLFKRIVTTALMMLIGLYTFAQSTVFISQVTDPVTYQGRYVQLYNSGSSAVDLGAGNYYLVKQANGGSYYSVQLTGTIEPGGVFVIAGYSDFSTLYGFAANITSSQVSGNGDDGYYLYIGGDQTSGTMIDAYGQPDVRPTSGESWYYENGKAVRNSNICAGNTTWTASEWTITIPSEYTDMDPANHSCSAGPDTQAPSWDSGYPKAEKVEDTRGILKVKLDEACTTYYIIVPAGSTAPTSAEVKAGVNYGSVTVGVAGNINVLTSTIAYPDTVTGATASTSYDIYFAAEDASSNLQASPAMITITTTAARSLSMTAPIAPQTYSIGEHVTFTWTSANIDSLYLVASIGGQMIPVTDNQKPIAASLNTYTLIVPADAVLGQYDFYLMDAYDTSFNAKEGPFTLQDNRQLTFTEPVADQIVYVGDTAVFRWNSQFIDSVLIGGQNLTQGDRFMLTAKDIDHPEYGYKPVPADQDSFAFYLDPKMVSGNQTLKFYIYSASDITFKDSVSPVYIVDTFPMTIRSSVPTFGMTDFPPAANNISCSFGSDIKAGTGALHLFKSDGSLVEDVPVANLNIQGDMLSFIPNPSLVPGQSYYIQMDSAIVKTADDSKTFAGVKGTDWSFTVASSDLYFSEYIEGTSNNKALEIYNPTDHDISLDNYVIASAYDGGGFNYDDVYHFPSGYILKAGEVFVLANSSAGSEILSKANDAIAYNASNYVVGFNGNDARALIRLIGENQNQAWVDVIGDPNNNPGSAGWSVAGVDGATVNHTLLRKSSVMYGTINWGVSAGTNATDSEWIVWPQDDFDNLGSPTPAGSDEAEVTGITLKNSSKENVTVTSSIDANAKTIDVTVLNGTDVTQLYADLQVSTGATVTPDLSTLFDFSVPIVFHVTSESTLNTVDWTVSVSVATASSSEKDITGFSIPNQSGESTINATNHTVDLTMPYGTDLTSLTPTIEVSAGATISPLSGSSQNFSAPVTYTVTAQDASTQDWTVTVVAETAQNVPIYDIQYTTDASGDSPYKDMAVKTHGVVTGLNIYNSVFKGFYIQDSIGAWNGVYVYDSQYPTVQIGDSVELIGTVTEYNGLTEITSLTELNVLAQGVTLPGPAVVATGDYANEMWESVYSKFENAMCTDNTLTYGYVAFDDGSGSAKADDFLYSYNQSSDFTVNNVYNVTGIILYNYGGFTMNPLSASDIEDVTGINEPELADKVTLYPNPNNGIFRINTNGIFNGDVKVRVIDVTGRVVYQQIFSSSSNISVNISNMSNNIYFITVEDQKHSIVKKFIKK
ncbi:MAG: lamin tail domain-containing protein [Bacteroidales bacterium]|nr:lamin tail domain-containing protein [Bacteroidales bacterium]